MVHVRPHRVQLHKPIVHRPAGTHATTLQHVQATRQTLSNRRNDVLTETNGAGKGTYWTGNRKQQLFDTPSRE